jgi:hypothetical protein
VVRLASTYEEWLAGGGTIKGNENVKFLSSVVTKKRKIPEIMTTPEWGYFEIEEEDINNFNKEGYEEYDSILDEVERFQEQIDQHYQEIFEEEVKQVDYDLLSKDCW